MQLSWTIYKFGLCFAFKNHFQIFLQLLERPPGLPIEETVDKSIDSAMFNAAESCNNFQWQQILVGLNDDNAKLKFNAFNV